MESGRSRDRCAHLATDPDAHERARLRASGRTWRRSSTAPTSTSSRKLADRIAAAIRADPRRRRRSRRADRRAQVPARRRPIARSSRATASSIADVNVLTESMAVGHEVGAIFEGERRFALVVKTKAAYEGDLDVLARAPPPVGERPDRSARRRRDAGFVEGPAQIESRQAIASRRHRVQRSRSRSRLRRPRRASRRPGQGDAARRVPHRVGRQVRALRGGQEPSAHRRPDRARPHPLSCSGSPSTTSAQRSSSS